MQLIFVANLDADEVLR